MWSITANMLEERSDVAENSGGPAGPRLAYANLNVRDALSVWRRHFEVYLRLWRMELAAPLIEPVFMVLAFGWGVGALVASKAEGMSYLSFVGAGVLSFTTITRALFESAYGAYFRMVYQSTFDAILATPVEAESLAFAEIVWATTKSLIDSLIILLVLWAFGAATSPFALFAPFALVLGGFFISALTLSFTARIHDIDSFNLYLSLYFSAIFLCGVWFPVDVMPAWLQWLAWAIPLTSAVDLARSFLVGAFKWRNLYEAAYLLAACAFCAEWAMRSLRRRMLA
jgi:lipooligosaccharide transport system permease protein